MQARLRGGDRLEKQLDDLGLLLLGGLLDLDQLGLHLGVGVGLELLVRAGELVLKLLQLGGLLGLVRLDLGLGVGLGGLQLLGTVCTTNGAGWSGCGVSICSMRI